MVEQVIPDGHPALLAHRETRSTHAQDHLRPFAPVSGQRGVDDAPAVYTTHATDQQQQNGEQPDEPIPALPIVIARIHARVQAFLAESHPPGSLLAAVQQQTRTSLEVVATALQRYKISELSLSYNGGKDCLVLLILFLAGLHPYTNHEQTEKGTSESESELESESPVIPSIYALPPDPFPAVEDFVLTSAEAYHLSITKYTTAPPTSTLRSSFEDYLALHPGIKAIFVGTRRTDPHGAQLTHFDRTDHGWPDFMRIHPVIDWQYTEIWSFIRHLGLTYCSLYDDGYTSLGGTSDTLPNPRLQKGEGYLPAYELTHALEERLGRN
ncbi:hypothetical protein N7495_006520 [Penicillium taxi]|uniref:uncharacterized protein n=1 Tax=Penicillium taxi TaxID=168475 RepID=UPI002545B3CC|nr:uncharacterized protein N7495_006520 [Penicillium taxi]KAJ5894829.1 hypothetical protein N7495_006520 [Penicillium taxi]